MISQGRALNRREQSRCHIRRHPRRQTSDTAHLVADQIRLAGCHIIPEGIRALEVGAVLDGARKGGPVTEQAGTAYFDIDPAVAHVEADEGVVVDAEDAEVDDRACLVVDVGLGLGEGLEVTCVSVADDVCGDGIACVAGIALCVLYLVSLHDHGILPRGPTNLEAQCTMYFPVGC